MQQAPGEVVYWQDDIQATLKPQEAWQPLGPSPENFGGAFQAQSEAMGDATADWHFPLVLAGDYRLCVWIPPTEATLHWQVRTDQGATWEFDQVNLPDPITLDTVEFQGRDYHHWVCLGTLKVTQSTSVEVRLSGKGTLVADAVFLIAAPPVAPTSTPTATSIPTPTVVEATATPEISPTDTPMPTTSPATETPVSTSAPASTSSPAPTP